METSFYSDKEIADLGFKSCGEHVLISRKTSIYGAANITIGNYVRIDDFCILSGNITLGSYIHLAAYTALFGGAEGIQMMDFSALSARCVVYAETDDYLGGALTNPTIPNEFRNVSGGKVTLHKHAIVGAGTCILPDVVIAEGVSVGSMSLVNKSLEEWGVYAGCPCKRIRERKKDLLSMEYKFKQYIEEQRRSDCTLSPNS